MIKTGDLNIESGSAKITGEKGIHIESSSPYYPAVDASSPGDVAIFHGLGSNYSSSVLSLLVDQDVSSNFKFLEAKTIFSNEPLFAVDGNGMCYVSFCIVNLKLLYFILY